MASHQSARKMYWLKPTDVQQLAVASGITIINVIAHKENIISGIERPDNVNLVSNLASNPERK